MSKWQPIETAPRDRTDILAWDEWGGGIAIVLECVDGVWVDWRTDKSRPWRPTHWMPLPIPPEDQD